MKYMLLTYLDEKKWLALSADEQKRLMDTCRPHVESLLASGKLLSGAPLHPQSMSTTVSVKNGKTVVTDGPFIETREALGGYSIIEAKDIDEAIAIAAGFQTPESFATIELRPIFEPEAVGR